MRRAALVVAVLLLPTAAGSYTLAGEDPEWSDADRLLEVERRPDGFTATATSLDEKDVLEFLFDANTGQLDSTWTNPDGRHARSIFLTGLLEFDDQDGDGRLGLGDPLLQRMAFSDLRLDGVVLTEDQGAQHIEIDLLMAQGSGGGINIEFWFVPTPIFIDGDTVSPSKPRMELDIRGFPFVAGNGSHLAIDTRLTGSVELQPQGVVGEGSRDWSLSWNRSLPPPLVTQQGYAATAGNQTLLILSYPAMSTITLDLEIGFALVPPTSIEDDFFERVTLADWRLWAIGFMVAALVAAIATAIRFGKRS